MDQATQFRLQSLDQVLQGLPPDYQSKDRVRNDVFHVMRFVSTLQPAAQTFSGQGRAATLFYLYGVLPINYGGNTYNIPVTIYLDPPYPRSAPRGFVTPSGNMALAENHPTVDAGGMYTGNAAKNWNPSASLSDLLNAMTTDFAVMPPVFAKGSGSAGASNRSIPQAKAKAKTQAGGGGGWFNNFWSSPAKPVSPPAAQREPSPPASTVDGFVKKAVKNRWPEYVGDMVDEVHGHEAAILALKDEGEVLEKSIDELRTQASIASEKAALLDEVEAELQTFLHQNAHKEPNPDDMKDQLNADSQMVLDLTAEEMAIEEFISALDDLLGERKISLDDFLREVRDASRRKYMCIQQRKKSTAIVIEDHGNGVAVAPPSSSAGKAGGAFVIPARGGMTPGADW